MIQLAFEATFDPFHAAFRILRQMDYRQEKAVSLPRLKIIDLYIAEPARCEEIRLTGSLKRAAHRASACQPATYGLRPGTMSLFNRMAPMQEAAIQTLVLQQILDADAFGQGQALRTDRQLGTFLMERIQAANSAQAALMDFLCVALNSIPFAGVKGLKDRTGIGEFKYDVV